jgi:hypothetical protein
VSISPLNFVKQVIVINHFGTGAETIAVDLRVMLLVMKKKLGGLLVNKK